MTKEANVLEGKGSIASITIAPLDLKNRLETFKSETIVVEIYSQLNVKLRSGPGSVPLLHAISMVRLVEK